ncbi:sugar ABC transporter permease [Enterococcus casseliflavus]|uniref:sugar ABC transporter permease n=1 Tax=Enterococcus casseliflavus TaxID=37734 RepID=UPI0012E18676|nr:sugar ABC transporter permease [Enterococcus casseliflavus]MUN72863.1 ABC transporter permease subunit [Enterococcus casseliflavus]MUN95818.1 ABC transporter permease subunit [Enterococcus casseliflavus]
MKKNKKWKLLFSYLLVGFLILVIVYPLLWTIGASFNPGNSLMSTSLIPQNPTLEHYKSLFSGERFPYFQWYLNSMKISIISMSFTLILVSISAYSFSRFKFRGRKNGLMIFLLLQMVPQFSALVAIFVLGQLLGLINNHFYLILIYVGGQIPFNTYLMKGYLDSIPKELDEAALIDGANSFQVFTKVILPLARPIIAVVAFNSFTAPLGDYIISSTLLRTEANYTLPQGLFMMVNNKMGASYTMFAAGAILIAIPVTCVFMMIKKNFISGLTAGSAKG